MAISAETVFPEPVLRSKQRIYQGADQNIVLSVIKREKHLALDLVEVFEGKELFVQRVV
jgi:hypothetical protein